MLSLIVLGGESLLSGSDDRNLTALLALSALEK